MEKYVTSTGVTIITDNYTRRYECTCPSCTSVFEFNRNCAAVIHGDDISITCPLCKTKIHLADRKDDEFVNVKEITKREKAKPKKILVENKNANVQTTKKETTTKTKVLHESQNTENVVSKSTNE